jgi:putative endonuclease
MSESRYLFVYILKCSDNSYYTGVTNNPERRIEEHNSGENKNSYTSQRLPVEMIYCEKFTDFNLAIIWEKKIKDWSRKKKEALIKENWDQLKIEAACKNYTSHKNLVGQASSVLDSARTETQESLSAQTVVVRSQSHFTIVDTNA